ncbi:MATE family efflux transporter [Hoyosella rhizosphaerae]|uniref:MATE family efflux transporter n=1 Tax=Hoyosella rhizosphaerae TaxID=1755582 RepID=A0A916XCG9_9ACTN|nr:MATE family efflux transporter [Hoyosella rhizosphaerae]
MAASPRRVAALALPAFGVLAAEPLYLLYDFAIVGRLGGLALAGLAVGGLVFAQVTTQLTFITYGTTARAARHHGANDRIAAVREGVQATWLAAVIGAVIVVLMQVAAGPILRLLTGDEALAAEAGAWLTVAIFGAPMILIAMAGNGWMRGVHNTMRPLKFVLVGLGVSAVLCPMLVYGWLGAPQMGLVGSAVANVIGQSIAATLFIAALYGEWRRAGGMLDVRPQWTIMRAQVVLGRDLILRSLAFQACFLSAAAVAARFGPGAVAAHQLMLHLWNLVALTLDSLAIAAQALIGAALGAGQRDAARTLAWRITRWSTVFAIGLAAFFALSVSWIPPLFTGDDVVLSQTNTIWWFFVALIPVAGVVFALDGVLLGSGDAAFLRNATLFAALTGFFPLIWASLVFGWGLPGIWTGLAAFILIRAVTVVLRTRSQRWSVVGADRQRIHRSSISDGDVA